MNYFENCETLEDVKKCYRDLCKVHHPDKGGELRAMQEINLQYTRAIKVIAQGGKLTAEEVEAEILNAEAYKNALNAIQNLEGIVIELCGGWLWISGNTKPHREIFKANGFFWASKKYMWYFRSVEYKSGSGKTQSMEEIRTKYGSQPVFNTRTNYYINA